MAGIGRVHELEEYGFDTTGIEIEPEWANMHPHTWLGDATALPFASDSFDAICVSPCYGNRMADHHDAKDASTRRTYKHDLGRDLHPNNAGQLQWGKQYRAFHILAWTEAIRVLRSGGRFVLNVKDHIRAGKRQYVAGWHVSTLCRLGLDLTFHIEVGTPGMRYGENRDARVPEMVYVLDKS
jgi:hypothetical protein